ncbi:flagellar motor protein PomA [Candidatus Berkiella cookevillensis]|uniref:Chemotaxis protein PomA n=1 Tax=Candidatus Berkiella cookevillensis TaxID=437022 RepID=A0A0Q9Y9C7_9GAMM|nr:flagellar motor protein PomA [Candidatus Berkiella cookevillensis]MCS5707755.1 flagellar motor protein PomA [Candidatus Berkiella cookevillensis]
MDLATFIGLIGSFAIIAYSMIMGGGIGSFFDISSISIVVLGSILVVMTKFGFKQFLGAFKSAGKIFLFKKFNPAECIDEAVKIATAARKSGLLALEGIEVKNHFMKRGVQLMIDGHEPDVVKLMLSKDMNLAFERHMVAQKVFRSLAEVAPAMGMIGTLIGLVLMLGNMSDPSAIGPSMAIALLATLYGAMLANMIANPIADKLELRSSEERRSKALVLDALLGIQSGHNPRLIEETLMQYMPNSKRVTKSPKE